jgi:hypothetical protein
MARKRMISPEFFTSIAVNALPIAAMVTFAGLWIYFDDYGRGEDDTALIKAAVWPRRRAVSERVIAAHLDLIEAEHLICRYQIVGYPIMHSPSWHEHQKISHRAEPRLPPCPEHEPGLHDDFRRDSGGPLEKFRSTSGATPRQFSVVKSNLIQENRSTARAREDLA